MDIKKLQKVVIDALEDVKAQDIKLYDTTHLTGLFDRICIASGTSNRQTKALASSVREKVKEKGGHVVSMEGEDTGEWVLVDLGDMVVHIMQPVIRGYYRLEELWGEKEVKFGAAKRAAKAAAATTEEEPKKPAARISKRATQTTVEEESENPVKKPRAKKASSGSATKKAIGTTVRVAKSKTAIKSAKEAAAKKVTTKRAAPKRKPAA